MLSVVIGAFDRYTIHEKKNLIESSIITSIPVDVSFYIKMKIIIKKTNFCYI